MGADREAEREGGRGAIRNYSAGVACFEAVAGRGHAEWKNERMQQYKRIEKGREEQKMIDFQALQKRVYQNKVNHGFNITNVPLEFTLTYGELAEAFEAWRKKKDSVGEELADVLIYLMGLAEILNVDLERELLRKMEINENRRYASENGVLRRVEE